MNREAVQRAAALLLIPFLLSGCSRADREAGTADPFARVDTVRFEADDRFPALGERFSGLLGTGAGCPPHPRERSATRCLAPRPG